MTDLDTLTAEARELQEQIAACRRPGRRLGIKASSFRGYGVPMGLPDIGSKMTREDYVGKMHEVRVIDHDGVHWSDSTCGQEGRWIGVEIPAEYVTRAEASMRMRLTEIEVDLLQAASES